MSKFNLPKKIIFTITSGRSGTNYLCDILSILPNVVSLHEAEPRFDDYTLDLLDVEQAKEFLLTKKIPAIENLCIDKDFYIETSHVFCKGFLEAWLDLEDLPCPDIILLNRDCRKIAQSLCRLNTIPGKTKKGNQFCLHPDSPFALTKLADWEALTDYQLCYWYTQEIEARKKHFSKIIEKRGGKTVSTTAEALAEKSEFYRVIDTLSLPKPNITAKLKYLASRNKKVNTKANRGQEVTLEKGSLEKQEREVLDRMGLKNR